jgi:hypothetical protein
MSSSRAALLWVFGFASAACIPTLAQSVVSTHSGIVYFFDGSVSIDGERMEQRFGRFPDIGEGRELRTEQGRAEVLLTPGVILRVGENSSIRMLSTGFSDTRVELLGGSAILEANEPPGNTMVTVIYRSWRVHLPGEGVYRLDSQPPQVTVYKGDAEVSASGGTEPVVVRTGQTLPLASILVPQQSDAEVDAFKGWAMRRSQAVSSDNATAGGIMDDPSAIENSAGALGGFSYFPLTGIPGVAVTNPYGLSFWSPYQWTLSSIYFPAYSYGALYPVGWPSTIRYPPWRPPGTVGRLPIGVVRPPGGFAPPKPPSTPPRLTPRPVPVVPRPGARH